MNKITAVVVILLAGITFASYEAYRAYSEQQTIWRLRQQSLLTQIDSLNHQLKRVDTVYKHDTLTLYQDVAQIEHDTIEKHIHDTAYVLRYVALVDTTIKACTRVLLDCDHVVRILSTDTAVQHNRINLLEKQLNSKTFIKPALLGLLVGIAATAVLKK